MRRQNEYRFSRLARETATQAGRPWAFALAAAFVLVWLISGPVFRFSDTWQLVMNTLSSIVTFLMVFLIQNAQNRDSEALQLKLDELIKSTNSPRDVIGIEEKPEPELKSVRKEVAGK
ncbi:MULTISPECIES: low affinity iron permease family protein [unclassified Bradyrhizobium]|uniref:low affinity iron permease family protein n=1 Tax=unclassified Bradyrhizobium TaxID=2631580 RepID=UPI00247909A6|nr:MULTISPECIES: low affinity iron permease family protein [unclassified Bradyrhizobium]WGR72670.1 low affinity iron permease family protein [Bradyrhizobium sp. ISRA426]WGR77503.1 low affinity iron permease family protein [Bradyrhizobium sp. ISRA430]WGR87909.1 low affinity iron permease family protein [Bradyrhizobium sp. ISRA432]